MITTTTQGIYSGVCLSTARPTTPYLGQVIFETDTNKMKVWLGSVWSDGYTHVYTPPSFDYDSLATVTVPVGGQSTVTFSSIPSTYKHLQVRAISRTTFAGPATGVNARLNSDTGSNYASHQLYSTGAFVDKYALSSQSSMSIATSIGSTGLASAFGVFVLDIFDYANTNKNTTVRSLLGKDLNGSGEASLYSGVWMNSSAVTTLTILPSDASNFAEYSSFALYGIKG